MCNREKIIQDYRNLCKQYDTKKSDILEKLKKFPSITVEDHVSKSKVCFVFSCPGDKELIANKVCAGATGDNLNTLLEILSNWNPIIFPSTNRYDYAILNATNIVHFKELDGKTEAYKSEIQNKDNLDRIERFFKCYTKLEIVVLFGEKAHLLEEKIQAVNPKLKIAKTRHLGYQSINRIEKDINDNLIEDDDPKHRTEKRLEVIAKEITDQIKL